MATPVPAYLINLDENTDRLAASRAALSAAGLQATRVPAVDGRGLDLNRIADCDAQAALRRYGRPLKGGEYGCCKSHLACLAQSRLDWHMVNLGAPGTRIFTPLTDLGAGHRLVAAHYFPQTAHAILWSRAGATAFVRDHARVGMTVDNLFRHVMIRSGKGLAVTPPLVRTTAAVSVIDAGQQAGRYAGRRWNFGLLKQKRFWVNRLHALYRKATYRRADLPDGTAMEAGLTG